MSNYSDLIPENVHAGNVIIPTTEKTEWFLRNGFLYRYTANPVQSWTPEAAGWGNDNGVARRSIRNIIPSSRFLIAGLKVQVGFKAGAGNMSISSASIGQQDANYDTVAAPVQLLFSGNAGVIIGSGEIVWSDTAIFTLDITKNQIVTIDMAASGDYVYYSGAIAGYSSGYKATTASYNSQTVTGFSAGAYIEGVYGLKVVP